MHLARRRAVAPDQVSHIEAGDCAISHPPFSGNHDVVRARCAAQHQRRKRIAMTGKPQLIELEQCKVSLFSGGDFAKLGPANAGRRSLGCPAQRILVADAFDAISRALNQKRRADFLHQV